MGLKEFSIGFSRTVNLGRYESARVEASVTYACDEGTTMTPEVIEAAQKELGILLDETWKEKIKNDHRK